MNGACVVSKVYADATSLFQMQHVYVMAFIDSTVDSHFEMGKYVNGQVLNMCGQSIATQERILDSINEIK